MNKAIVTPNGHNLSNMHVQSILILLSEDQAPSHCSAFQSDVTCLSLIASLTCQISVASSGEIAKQLELIYTHCTVQVPDRRSRYDERLKLKKKVLHMTNQSLAKSVL